MASKIDLKLEIERLLFGLSSQISIARADEEANERAACEARQADAEREYTKKVIALHNEREAARPGAKWLTKEEFLSQYKVGEWDMRYLEDELERATSGRHRWVFYRVINKQSLLEAIKEMNERKSWTKGPWQGPLDDSEETAEDVDDRLSKMRPVPPGPPAESYLMYGLRGIEIYNTDEERSMPHPSLDELEQVVEFDELDPCEELPIS
jgi:hypothetical protein